MSLQIQLKKSAVTQKQPFAIDLAIGELALNYNADGPFLTCKDTAGAVRKLNHVWVAATSPTNPGAGDLWLDTSSATAVLKTYKDGSTTWVNAASIPLASTSVYGTVQLASSADITNGTAGKVVDAAQLQSKVTSEITAALSGSPTTIQNLNVVNNATIGGNLTVNGTTTTINTQDLLVKDKNIEMGVVDTPTDVTANGGGITLKGSTDKTINWIDATDAWTFSEHVDLASGKEIRIGGTKVLDATSLGSAVVSSGLTSVGTIGTGVWEGTAIDKTYLDATLVSTGDTGTVTSTMILDGTIVDADINASAAIAGTKIDPDFGSQTVEATGGLDIDTGLLKAVGSTNSIGLFGATPAAQPSAIADITTTATTGTLPTPDGTVTIADAAAPTVDELLEYCTELEAKLETALAALRTLGVIAT
jgi:hypothetical protein